MPERLDPERLEELARRHLWVYFAQLSSTADATVIVRGEGCHVFDSHGKRYLDGLAGLFLPETNTQPGKAGCPQRRGFQIPRSDNIHRGNIGLKLHQEIIGRRTTVNSQLTEFFITILFHGGDAFVGLKTLVDLCIGFLEFIA